MIHKHHIIPLHAGGTDSPENIKEGTLEQHAEEHRLLWEQHGRMQDYGAYMMLSGRIGKEELQRIWASMGGKAIKGIKRSPETRKKMGAWVRGEDFKNKFRGRKLTTDHIAAVVAGRSRNWEVTSPTGSVSVIKNLSKFCRVNDLDQPTMISVSKGKRTHHKQWKCRKVSS